MFALVNHKLLVAGKEHLEHSSPTQGKAVVVEGGRIVAIVNETELATSWPQCEELVDLEQCYLSPGLIDLQVQYIYVYV